ncbi:MAG: putative toxin-antitoxin system toxin component, PIN family, partial [Deltaproteobacteria bacterium]|nr:putative toxin-antitoxin system toxin component, PIN family [Deltaproteobacteria bacterium]
MRVVFDTNIFISALLFPGGRAEEALLRVIEGKDQLLVSRPLIHELVGVLAKKFSRNREELAHVAVYLSEIAELVRPGRRLKVLDDEPGNRMIECAVTGRAAVIVTGDKAMLRLSEYKGIRIITLNDYLTYT